MEVMMDRRGTLTIPAALRAELASEGQVFEAVRREDGVIELRPRDAVSQNRPVGAEADAAVRGELLPAERLTEPPTWLPIDAEPAALTPEQERLEREADAAIAAGRVTRSDDVESLIARLKSRGPAPA